VEAAQQGPTVLDEAVELASVRLETGDELMPLLITDRWGDRRIERFEPDKLADAKESFAEFVRSAAGDETCALVYPSPDAGDEEAMLIERGGGGYGPPASFVQRFRSRRSRFRGFKLIGKPEPVAAPGSQK
jgi:hypothetical protein